MNWESEQSHEAKSLSGVSYVLRRVSYGRRAELVRMARELTGRVEFLEAAPEKKGPLEKLEANLLGNELEQLYVRWGLVRMEGLKIDGEPATVEALIERGPEALVREVAARVRHELGLTEEERKN
jgi:hypothetical protein